MGTGDKDNRKHTVRSTREYKKFLTAGVFLGQPEVNTNIRLKRDVNEIT